MTTTEAYCKNPSGKNPNWKHSGSSGTAIWCKGHGSSGKVLGVTASPLSGGNVLVGKSTHYMSYAPCCKNNPNYDPKASTKECDWYSACKYPGIFAATSEKMSYEWVKNHNIVAFFDKANPSQADFKRLYAKKRIKVCKGKICFIAFIIDTCGDHDCGGCCSKNSHSKTGYLVDLEYNTARRYFGSDSDSWDGEVTFQIMDKKGCDGGAKKDA